MYTLTPHSSTLHCITDERIGINLYFYLPLCILNRKYNRYCFEDYFSYTIAQSMFETVLVTSDNTFSLQQLRYNIK